MAKKLKSLFLILVFIFGLNVTAVAASRSTLSAFSKTYLNLDVDSVEINTGWADNPNPKFVADIGSITVTPDSDFNASLIEAVFMFKQKALKDNPWPIDNSSVNREVLSISTDYGSSETVAATVGATDYRFKCWFIDGGWPGDDSYDKLQYISRVIYYRLPGQDQIAVIDNDTVYTKTWISSMLGIPTGWAPDYGSSKPWHYTIKYPLISKKVQFKVSRIYGLNFLGFEAPKNMRMVFWRSNDDRDSYDYIKHYQFTTEKSGIFRTYSFQNSADDAVNSRYDFINQIYDTGIYLSGNNDPAQYSYYYRMDYQFDDEKWYSSSSSNRTAITDMEDSDPCVLNADVESLFLIFTKDQFIEVTDVSGAPETLAN
jgi:hypothetical protein